MRKYKVFEKNGLLEVVPDTKWNWYAFFFGLLYLIYKRMFRLFVLVCILLVVIAAIYIFVSGNSNTSDPSNILGLITNLILAYNVNRYYQKHLINTGWTLIGEVEADSKAEVLRKFNNKDNNKEEYRDSNKKEEYRDSREYSEENEVKKACRILNVPESASVEQIKKVYRTLASIWHPDLGTVKDGEKMKEINWAYDVLIKYKSEQN